MANFNNLLQSHATDEDKLRFIFKVFQEIKKEVNDLLLFGPCNNTPAERAATIYHSKKRTRDRFFSAEYQQMELGALPAVIASSLFYENKQTCFTHSYDKFQDYLKRAYLYATGTCEVYAIVGAYYLAVKYDVDLSIETIFSEESHTYIRLHTIPEYILDFWDPMACNYNDSVTWNEVHGYRFIRNENAEFREDIQLNSNQLVQMGKIVFSEGNAAKRRELISKVMADVEIERSVQQPVKRDYLSNSELKGY